MISAVVAFAFAFVFAVAAEELVRARPSVLTGIAWNGLGRLPETELSVYGTQLSVSGAELPVFETEN
jgi:hypothetical protein